MNEPDAPRSPVRGRTAAPVRRLALAFARPLAGALAALALVGLLAGGLFAVPARAQHAGDTGTAPPPPAGDGRITVTVVNADAPADVAGLAIALYSLGSDGRPGFTNGQTDAQGRVTFANVSNDPGIVYLLGARYRDIPFGERVTFEAGRTEAAATIEVSTPTDRVEGVRVEELRVRLDWMGDRVLVREILRLVNSGTRVIQLPKAGTGGIARSIVARRLGEGAGQFTLGTSSMGDGLALEDGVVRYAGPLYPGDQTVEYQYTLPSPKPGEPLRVPIELDHAAARVVAIAGTAGMAIRGAGLVASSEVESDAGKALSAWARGALGARERSVLEATLPETRRGVELVSIPRADVWLDLDDTRVNATAELELEVAPGPPVAGTPDEPLLSVRLPEGASLTGVAPEAEGLGLLPRERGFDVVGPIGEGLTSLGFAYRLDAKPEGVSLDLRFPRAVSTLNVLIADTGLALESSRLHRLRPFRSGTRNYLHREAFNVAADETVDLRIEPLRDGGLPREAGMAFAFVAIAGAAAYLAAPLTRRARTGAAPIDASLARLAAEREAIYTAIRDLDHDFETGKLEAADHATMRETLRAQAIELLAAERAGGAAGGATTAAPAAESAGAARAAMNAASATTAASAAAAARPEADAGAGSSPAGFCPACGAPRQAAWRFCASCGAALPERTGGPA
ncbi:MAG: zinc ribbon domain-containing protein [Myxococcota bacterium]